MAKLQGNGSEIFDHNFKTEYKAGKPMKQSLAIAYAMKKKSQNKAMGGEMHDEGCPCPKCCDEAMMKDGGEVEMHSPAGGSKDRLAASNRVKREEPQKGVHKSQNVYTPGSSKAGYNSRALKEGPVFKEQAKAEHHKVLEESRAMPKPKLQGLAEGGEVSPDDDDLVMRIMKKRYSMGGEVSNDTGEGEVADEMPNQFDDLVLDDSLEDHDTGANSGDELGNSQEDEDRHDIISRIMKSRAKKDKNPRPA